MQDLSHKKMKFLIELLEENRKTKPDQIDTINSLISFFQSNIALTATSKPTKPKESTEDKAKWLQFRDHFVAKQTKLACLYCNKVLLSDAPTMPCKLKDHIFRRKKHIPKQDIATIDHVIPVSKGGAKFDENNMVIACHSCNGSKADKSFIEFMEQKNR